MVIQQALTADSISKYFLVAVQLASTCVAVLHHTTWGHIYNSKELEKFNQEASYFKKQTNQNIPTPRKSMRSLN